MPNVWGYSPEPNRKGIWLLPKGSSGNVHLPYIVRIQAEPVSMSVPMSAIIYRAPFRKGQVIHLGKVHNPEGNITGKLIDADYLTQHEWANRLEYLVEEQGSFDSIALTAPKFSFANVALVADSYEITPSLRGDYYEVSVPFVVIDEF